VSEPTNQRMIWRCDDYESALRRAAVATGVLMDDVGVWSFDRGSRRRFYVAPMLGRMRFASHLCTVIGYNPLESLAAA